MTRIAGLLAAFALLLAPARAAAAWREASSTHFLVYSEGREEKLRETAVVLEKYFFVLRALSGIPAPRPGQKIKVYLMKDMGEVQQTSPVGSNVAGYYTSSERGAIAVGVRSDIGPSGLGLAAQHVLFHELAHHFMFQYFPAAYPAWFSEGFADYYGTMKIGADDVVEVGHPLHHRYLSFQENAWIPLDKLLTAKGYSDVGAKLHLLYAQGWLLVHYLNWQKQRSGQLRKYLNAINAGQSYTQAMNQTFGPGAQKLDSELRDYAAKQRIMTLTLPFKRIDPGEVRLRTLSAAEDDLVRQQIALERGLMKIEASKFASSVRSIARRHPDDPYALEMLVEAERAVADHAAAGAAIDKWLALKPGDPRALMHKGDLRVEQLQAAGSTDAKAWDEARALLLQANRAKTGDPRILLAYYESFARQGVLPPAGAQNGLMKAFELIPQDDDLRYRVAADFERRGMIEDAIAIIRPAALALHEQEDPRKKRRREKTEEKFRLDGEEKRETAREMLLRLEAKLPASARAAS